jgi:hypothetical protein
VLPPLSPGGSAQLPHLCAITSPPHIDVKMHVSHMQEYFRAQANSVAQTQIYLGDSSDLHSQKAMENSGAVCSCRLFQLDVTGMICQFEKIGVLRIFEPCHRI